MTLVELMVALTMGAIFSLVVAQLMTRINADQKKIGDRENSIATLALPMETFRHDLRFSYESKIVGRDLLLKFYELNATTNALDTIKITYSYTGSVLTRTQQNLTTNTTARSTQFSDVKSAEWCIDDGETAVTCLPEMLRPKLTRQRSVGKRVLAQFGYTNGLGTITKIPFATNLDKHILVCRSDVCWQLVIVLSGHSIYRRWAFSHCGPAVESTSDDVHIAMMRGTQGSSRAVTNFFGRKFPRET